MRVTSYSLFLSSIKTVLMHASFFSIVFSEEKFVCPLLEQLTCLSNNFCLLGADPT